MEKRIAIISGGSSGIGLELAKQFIQHAEGKLLDAIYLIGRREFLTDKDPLLSQDKIKYIAADLSKIEDRSKVKQTLGQDVKIIYMLHAIGLAKPDTNEQNSQDLLKEHIGVNVTAPIELTKQLSSFCTVDTRILFLTSKYIFNEPQKDPVIFKSYCESKRELLRQIKALRLSSKESIICSINPGPVKDTKMFNDFHEALRQINPNHTPTSAAKSAEEIAKELTDIVCIQDPDFRIRLNRDYASITDFKASDQKKILATLSQRPNAFIIYGNKHTQTASTKYSNIGSVLPEQESCSHSLKPFN